MMKVKANQLCEVNADKLVCVNASFPCGCFYAKVKWFSVAVASSSFVTCANIMCIEHMPYSNLDLSDFGWPNV